MFDENIVFHVEQLKQAAGRRRYRREASGSCSKCGAAHDAPGRYCRPCRAAYNRARNARIKKEIEELRAIKASQQQHTDGTDNGRDAQA